MIDKQVSVRFLSLGTNGFFFSFYGRFYFKASS